jgi:hypothetical protein
MYNYQKTVIKAMLADFNRMTACIKLWFLYMHARFYKGKMRARFYVEHNMIKKGLLPPYVIARSKQKRIDWIYRSRTHNFWNSSKAHAYEGRGRQ